MLGGLNGALHNTYRLFELPAENRALSEHIAQLEQQLDYYTKLEDSPSVDQIVYSDPDYTYTVGRVVSNSINRKNNYIVVDKGVSDGIYQRMAVITPTGEMLGYVEACSDRYCAVLSILSTSFTTSGKIEGGDNYGSIRWQGKDRYHVSMRELSKYESVEVGDKVVSTGFSQIFPRGVTIGHVASFSYNEMHTAYNVEVELAAHLTSLDYVLLVGNRESGEVESMLDYVQQNR